MAIDTDALDTAISNLMVKEKIDYKEGDVEVNGSDHLNSLIKLRESLIDKPQADLELMSFDFDIDIFGKDRTQTEL